mmetsp:Transcript_13994/g.24966  ORF Transcript_13994/g.24966 Transcript_13994/m.24966 type:complete len:334 (+) Transcript_13994:9958-10959(+)
MVREWVDNDSLRDDDNPVGETEAEFSGLKEGVNVPLDRDRDRLLAVLVWLMLGLALGGVGNGVSDAPLELTERDPEMVTEGLGSRELEAVPELLQLTVLRVADSEAVTDAEAGLGEDDTVGGDLERLRLVLLVGEGTFVRELEGVPVRDSAHDDDAVDEGIERDVETVQVHDMVGAVGLRLAVRIGVPVAVAVADVVNERCESVRLALGVTDTVRVEVQESDDVRVQETGEGDSIGVVVQLSDDVGDTVRVRVWDRVLATVLVPVCELLTVLDGEWVGYAVTEGVGVTDTDWLGVAVPWTLPVGVEDTLKVLVGITEAVGDVVRDCEQVSNSE